MCDIWKQQKSHDITPLELRKVLDDPLFTEVRGVGMNGGEPTLRNDLALLATELCDGLPRLQAISLITNGLKPHLVIPRVSELYAVTKQAGIKLDIMLSLDGVGDVHDRVRGRLGNFKAVEECLQYFLANNIGDAHRLGCTLIAENIEHAEHLMLWSERQGVYCRFRVGIPHQRLYTKDKTEPFALTNRQRFHLCNFLDTLISRYEAFNPSRRLYLKNLRNQIAYGYPRANGCAWQDEGVTLLSNGDFAYCAVESPNLGNLLGNGSTASTLYQSGKSIRDDLINKKCDSCLHDYEGRIPRLRDRLLVRGQQALYKYHLPAKPLRSLKAFSSLALNSLKLMDSPLSAQAPVMNPFGKDRVLIVGWYGTETLGDKAILYSIIQGLNVAGVNSESITIASIEPYITKYTLNEYEQVNGCSVVSLSEALAMARAGRYSQVIFGGGPIMSSIGYLCPIAAIFRAVKKAGGQSIIWGCGLGPIRKLYRDLPSKIAISQILNLADVCVFRDQQSLDLAMTFVEPGFNGDWAVALDPAFHWVTSVALSSGQIGESKESKSEVIGFAIRDLPITEYFSDFKGDALALKSEFELTVAALMNRHFTNSSLYLQCMHRLPCGGDDRLFYYDFLGEKAIQYGLTFEHRSPLDDVAKISRLDRLYAMRFHSVVFGVALGVPVIPVDYTNGGKITSLCQLFQIRCWNPSEFVAETRNGSELIDPQLPDQRLVSELISKSQATYLDLAQKVVQFSLG